MSTINQIKMDRLRLGALPLVLSLGCNTPPDKHVTNNYITECDTDTPPEETQENDTNDSGVDSGDAIDSGDAVDSGEIIEELSEVEQNDTPWPTEVDTIGANMASALIHAVSDFEVSGLVHHKDRNTVFVTDDNGGLAEINLTEYGRLVNHWDLSGDLEGVTVGPDSHLYLANETERGDSPASGIMRFDLDSETMETACVASDLPTNGSNSAFEAITYVPFKYAPENWGSDENGYFIAGTQHVAELSVYAATPCTGGAEVTSVYTIPVSHSDVAGLAFNIDTQRLYVLYDSENKLDVFKTTGDFMISYDLPSEGANPWGQQEGIDIFNVNCGESYDNYHEATADLGIAEDLGGLYLWTKFPVSCQPELSTE